MIINILKVAIAVAAVILGVFLQLIINAKRIRRIRQLPLVPVSVVYAAVAVVLANFHLEWIDPIIRLHNFLTDSNLLMINFIILLGFVIIKLIVRPIITAVCSKYKILKYFTFGLYEFDEDYEQWFLKKQWVNFRKYFFALICGLTLSIGAYLGMTWVLGPVSVIWMLLFPCAALVAINEFYSFVNGQTKEEYEHSILGEEADARRVGNYYKLREILEKILPEPLLAAHIGFEFARKESPADLIKQLKESEDTRDRITGEYFDTNNRYKTAEIDSVQATLHMMHHENVVFYNPFYKDLSVYILLPMANTLLSGKKCLALCGRKTITEDVKEWLTGLFVDYSHMRNLWRVDALSDQAPECEVGILTFSQIFDKNVLNANREFLKETDFVLMIEPSYILNTSQIALSILAEEIGKDGDPIYCVCDRRTDGIVDTISHIVRAEFLNVYAMPVPRCNYTAMSWDADGDFHRQQLFDKQTRYLGSGTELAAIAVKNQIPKVSWYSESKIPVSDLKWIAGQHYSTICKYMNIPAQQKSLYEKVEFISRLWSSVKTKEQFVIVEDEFCNMFSMMRAYLSRGLNQIFVNVLSENYLLRDYMRCNQQMFMSNPNAIPLLVPDYAKTERNTIIKLILMMTLRQVTEEEVLNEFHLAGIETNDAFRTMSELLGKYTYANSKAINVRTVRTNIDDLTTKIISVFNISDDVFDAYFAESLKNAYFILEDEMDHNNYIDSRLFSHVTQIILPGQYITYDGKYYIAKHVTPQTGVVLRRASDLFDRRTYYKQIRTYDLSRISRSKVISSRTVMDIEFTELRLDFSVKTTGYLELDDNHNLRNARMVDFSRDPLVNEYNRNYRNKSILRIKLPEVDEKMCYTFCLLLSEVFRSVFPEGWPYLAAVTKQSEDIGGMLNYAIYSVVGELEYGYIYIIEDSDIDLGLLSAVEKYFMQLMEIVADFLEWHFEKMRESASQDPIPKKIQIAEDEERKRRNAVTRILNRIRKIFSSSDKEKAEENKTDQEISQTTAEKTESEVKEDAKEPAKEPDKEVTEQSTEAEIETEKETVSEEENGEKEYDIASGTVQESTEEKPVNIASVSEDEPEEEKTSENALEKPAMVEDDFNPAGVDDPDLVHIDGTDIFDNDGMPEDNEYLEWCFTEMGLVPLTKSRYQKECYLKYGFEEIDGRLQLDELRRYLRVHGWCRHSLILARKRDSIALSRLELEAENHCDFCGMPLSGVSYEVLNDGRVRCNDCSSSAINSVDEMRELFFRSVGLMRDLYSIKFLVPVGIKVADARAVAKGFGMVFKPSRGYTARVLGYAQKLFGKYKIVMENGSPRLAATDTLIHEMTHIWQYLNWDMGRVRSIYSMKNSSCTEKAVLIVYEGMAMWSAIQFLYHIGETYYAAIQELLAESRNDVYGIGFRLYRERYPFVKDFSLLKYSPFGYFPTLEPDDVKRAVKGCCTEEKCDC